MIAVQKKLIDWGLSRHIASLDLTILTVVLVELKTLSFVDTKFCEEFMFVETLLSKVEGESKMFDGCPSLTFPFPGAYLYAL